MSQVAAGACLYLGLGVMTWSPLAGGFLTGKYEDGVPLYSRASMKVRFVDVLQFVCFRIFLLWLKPQPQVD